MNIIKQVLAREILDSRGNPTIEVEITLKDGSSGRASVPSGASTGSHEAVELRDGDKIRFGGKGVLKAVENVNRIITKEIVGKDFDQKNLDGKLIKLDGTPNKSKLGANAILGVSLAFAHAQAQAEKIPLYEYFRKISGNEKKMVLPVPMILILEGGKHADGGSDLQEFMIVPHGAGSFKEALRCGSEIYHATAKILKSKNLNTNVGFEGAFGPNLGSNEKIFDLIIEGIRSAGYTPGIDVGIAIDSAASEFYENGTYNLKTENKKLSSKEMVEFYVDLCKKYPIISIEDGLAEDDWNGFELLTKEIGDKIQIVGDDLFVTNVERLQMGIDKNVANSILVKLNQIGTVTEIIETIKLARKNNYTSIVSHRSGETEDTTIADFVVGLSTGQIKTGSVSRTDRTAKYNQLLRIEEALGDKAIYAGKKAFKI